MIAAGAVFGPGNPYGVCGYGIERPSRGGRTEAYRSLVVYVERKLTAPPSPIPDLAVTFGGRTLRVRPDVQALGGPVSTSLAPFGGNVQFSGLHPGSAIAVSNGANWVSVGATTCLLGAATHPTHLLTAGHLFPPAPGLWWVYAAAGGGTPAVRVGRLVGTLLVGAGPSTGIDSAIVQLDPAALPLVVQLNPPLIPAMRFAVQGEQVQVYRPTAGTWSRVAQASVLPNVFHVNDAVRGTVTVKDVAFNAPVTAPGDSGGPLCSARPRAVLGSTVGTSNGCSLFEPTVRAVQAHSAALGTPLSYWRQ